MIAPVSQSSEGIMEYNLTLQLDDKSENILYVSGITRKKNNNCIFQQNMTSVVNEVNVATWTDTIPGLKYYPTPL